jgi:gamma-glutamyl-gamma-aminobutyrate hydrolase PuuD
MHDADVKDTPRTTRKTGRLRRRLLVTAAVLAVLMTAYAFSRFAVRAWIQTRLPANAPRIAFSLDNTLLGRLGITDATYQQAMARAGGHLVTVRPDAAGEPNVDPEAVDRLLTQMRIDGVLLTGGGDVDPAVYGGDPDKTMLVHRQRDHFEIALIQAARARNLPILGICRGCQILNVAFGGTLRNLRKDKKLLNAHLTLKGHSVELAPESRLAGVLGVTRLEKVISLHGQAVDRPGDGVVVAATGPEGIVEALESDPRRTDCWMAGIQWHPELAVTDEIQNKLFKGFVEQVCIAREGRSAGGGRPRHE